MGVWIDEAIACIKKSLQTLNEVYERVVLSEKIEDEELLNKFHNSIVEIEECVEWLERNAKRRRE